MFQCPHCGNPIEVSPPMPMSWWQYANTSSPRSLGCGTLIIIAIIVAVFSRGKDEAGAIRGIQTEIRSLQQTVDQLNSKIERLNESVSKNG